MGSILLPTSSEMTTGATNTKGTTQMLITVNWEQAQRTGCLLSLPGGSQAGPTTTDTYISSYRESPEGKVFQKGPINLDRAV